MVNLTVKTLHQNLKWRVTRKWKNDTVLKVKQKYHHFEGIKLGSKAELFLITAKQICRNFRIIAAMMNIF